MNKDRDDAFSQYDYYRQIEAEKVAPIAPKAKRLLDEERQAETQPKSVLSRVVYWRLYRKGQELGYADPEEYVQLRIDEGTAEDR